ncbi:hypothetical protein BD410DRAFT_788796 [Rickenella mellea]|uniref:Uncharacterized protein n=1 Tax=Rickenella mellea TaxID=50990 RepID=A0A4Y7Q4L5_9AGAM|nr:hypothetical protein BD410DRAFT_788796 [Rickenella mellea]
MSNPSSRNPPLAGKPPFATDEPDSVFAEPASRHRRLRQPQPKNDRPDSAYDVYDNYLGGEDNRQSGIGAVGMGLLSGDVDDDSDDEMPTPPKRAHSPEPRRIQPQPPTQSQPQPRPQQSQPAQVSFQIAAPKPGYAAPVSAINLGRPDPASHQGGYQARQQSEKRILQPISIPYPQPAFLPSPVTVPSTPHPLDAPSTPILPAFARPPKSPSPDNEKIHAIRGNSEETLLPKRGQKGDDFWRRFSMVAHTHPGERSTWLKKTETGYSRLSKLVWLIGVLILLVIGGAIALTLWQTRSNSTHRVPVAIGGSANDGVPTGSSSSTTSKHATNGLLGSATGGPSSSSSPHVSPTNTVQKRDMWVQANPTGVPIAQGSPISSREPSANVSSRHRRALKARIGQLY